MTIELLRSLGYATLASSAALLIMLALRRPMREGFGAAMAYALWALVPLAAAAMLLPAPVLSPDAAALSASTMQVIDAAPFAAAPLAAAFDPWPWLFGLWIAGVVFAALSFARQQRRFVRALGRLSPVANGIVRAQTTAGCPALIGALRPRVVLPCDFDERYSETERALILAHERAHRACGDSFANLFAAALRCAFWFNPLFHFAASRFRFDQELACDARVIADFPGARRSYADAMLKTQLADFGLPVGCHWQSSHPLKERIAMLKKPLPGRARTALGLGIAVALVAGGSYAAWASQPAAAPATAASADLVSAKATYRRLSAIAYPPAALAAQVEGVVYINARVGVDGRVADAMVERIDPPTAAVLSAAALEGVKSWTFNPARKNGEAIATNETVPIVFARSPQNVPAVTGATLDAIRIGPPSERTARSADSDASYAFREMDAPKYPADALKDKQTGKVVLKVHIDEHGTPLGAEIVETDPPGVEKYFADASIAAAMTWRFNPEVRDGKAHDGYALVPITFDLHDDQ